MKWFETISLIILQVEYHKGMKLYLPVVQLAGSNTVIKWTEMYMYISPLKLQRIKVNLFLSLDKSRLKRHRAFKKLFSSYFYVYYLIMY